MPTPTPRVSPCFPPSLRFAAFAFAAVSSFGATTPTVPPPLPAFPTAEGFGALATGGRGGEVYHVTNLGDAGPGSFRDAVAKGHRTVVFDVGGYVDLKSAVSVTSDLTIAGQTAPGEGIALRNYEVSFSGSHNLIVRYVRFRHGVTPKQEKKYAVGAGSAENLILDHCSIEWASWDGVGMSASKNITMQWCLIGENIDLQRFGCLCESDQVTFAHNLWIDNQSRNPKAKGIIQYVNNVVYNWGVTGLVGGHSAAEHSLDVLNNYFIQGPDSSAHFAGEFTATDHVFQSGNLVALGKGGTLNGRPVLDGDFGGGKDAPTFVAQVFNHPTVPVRMDSAAAACDQVLAGAGVSLHRDRIDLQLIAQVKSYGKTGKIIHDPSEVGGFGEILGGTPPPGATGDGIADAWKIAHGLDLKDPAVARGDYNHDGYSNLEKYVNELAGDFRPKAGGLKD